MDEGILLLDGHKNHSRAKTKEGYGNGFYANDLMKIRIQGNSIRYRLKQPEVESFQHSGQVTETIQLGMKPEEKLRFILQKSDVNAIALHYSSDTAVVLVPESIAVQWTDTDQV